MLVCLEERFPSQVDASSITFPLIEEDTRPGFLGRAVLHISWARPEGQCITVHPHTCSIMMTYVLHCTVVLGINMHFDIFLVLQVVNIWRTTTSIFVHKEFNVEEQEYFITSPLTGWEGLINQPVKNHCITTVEWEIISVCIPLLIEHWLQPKPNQVPHLSLYNVLTDMKLNRNQQVTLCGLRSLMMYHHLGLFLLLDSVKDAYTKFLWVPNKYLAFILRGNTPTKLSCI